jgi:hypothetical protein
MKRKIVGIVFCMLVIASFTTVTGQTKIFMKANDLGKNVEGTMSPLANDIWTKSYGGLKFDAGSSVQQTTDGGYIVVGITESYGAGKADVWLLKTDSSGNKTWDKTFGGTDRDFGNFVQQTSDGGYIITGSTASYGNGEDDVWLIKTDADGNELWDKTYGYSIHDSGSEVKQTSDGGYIIVGDVNTDGGGSGDIWVIKTDIDGNMVWNKTFDGHGHPISHDYGTSIGLTSDGGYIVAGVTFTTENTNDYDIWLIKIDANGNTIWDKKIGGPDSEFGFSVQQTNDGGYIITGIDSYGVSEKVWLIKTDDTGNIVWNETYSGSGTARGYSVQQTSDNGYIIAGETYKGSSKYDALLIKTDGNGVQAWSKTFGGTGNDIAVSVRQTTDGGYILTGYKSVLPVLMNDDLWLIKTDINGNSTFTNNQNSQPQSRSNPQSSPQSNPSPQNQPESQQSIQLLQNLILHHQTTR